MRSDGRRAYDYDNHSRVRQVTDALNGSIVWTRQGRQSSTADRQPAQPGRDHGLPLQPAEPPRLTHRSAGAVPETFAYQYRNLIICTATGAESDRLVPYDARDRPACVGFGRNGNVTNTCGMGNDCTVTANYDPTNGWHDQLHV